MLLSGRGGAIVPNRIDARCFAEPACGPLSSSSSSSELSRTDHSSSSAGLDLVRLGAETGSGKACILAMSCCERRWNGFVSFFSASGLVTLGVAAAEEADDCWFILLKNGFLDCSGGLVTGGLVTCGGEAGGSAGAERATSTGDLAALSGGVIICACSRPSSSELSSSSKVSSCLLSCSSFSFAA